MEKYAHILNDFHEKERSITHQIERLGLQQLEIQRHIADIETDVASLRRSIEQERDVAQRGKLFGILNYKLQILAQYYDLLKNFETVKCQYYKGLLDLTTSRHRLLEVDIRRLDERLQSSYGDILPVFERINDVLKQSDTMEDKYEL